MRVVVNAAMSADGKLSTRLREQVEISGPEDFRRMDDLRAESDAVLVGVGTVLADDPHLTLSDEDRIAERRERGRSAHPTRIVVDSRGRTPLDARILDDAATTYVLVSESASGDRIRGLRGRGARVIVAGEGRVHLPSAFRELSTEGIGQLMVEGGGELIFSLFRQGLVDRLTVYVGAVVIGGRDAPTLADGDGFVRDFPQLELVDATRIDDGVLLDWEPRK